MRKNRTDKDFGVKEKKMDKLNLKPNFFCRSHKLGSLKKEILTEVEYGELV